MAWPLACAVMSRVKIGCSVVVLAIAIMAWLAHRTLLQSVAELWIVSDPVIQADAVAVLGGGIEDRPFAAASYYREGRVAKVLLSNVREMPAEKIGAIVPHVEANRDVLLKLGVPTSAIEIFGSDLATTRDEALALRVWVEHTGAHSLIVPTEAFAARRLRWILHRTLGDGIFISVPALDDPRGIRPENWWQSDEGVVALQNEIIKYLYYRLRY
jgi:uncharacterized SAM-binding protein YcdF (DUF218 family)